jgi:hypothetical protein
VILSVTSPLRQVGRSHLLQPLVKPPTRLQEGTLFCVFLLRNIDIATNRKAMLHTAVKVDLVWQLDVFEDDFSLMAFLGRENCVGFCVGRDMSA